MFKTETELQLELFPRNWTETETEIMSGTEISLERRTWNKLKLGDSDFRIKCFEFVDVTPCT